MRMALIRLGVRFGFACKSNAAVPAATGAAIDEPLKYIMRLVLSALTLESNSGCLAKNKLSAAAAPTILLPGAMKSGFSKLSYCSAPLSSIQKLRVGPRELYVV